MIITKEQQEAWLSKYIKEGHTLDECVGFIDGIEIAMIKDVTPMPHNGCRPPKKRRV